MTREEAIENMKFSHGINEDGRLYVPFSEVIKWLKNLPAVQPEIIYCKDCRYKDDGIDENGIPFLKCLHGRSYGGTRINDFCSWAERRTE